MPEKRSFGGLGGYMGVTIPIEAYAGDGFVQALAMVCGDRMRESQEAAQQVWSALANVEWLHENGDDAGYSFRAAGDLIASIVGSGDYLNYYCNSPYATVEDWIEDAMATQGWRHDA